ncbi:MAG: FAD:protein FMN transferase, partial [Chitinivibrionales bacterium]|nr:FAD:protein FMN transferase [Chitinivibrionales bacterium]MBD3355884.1 FAD:protein FMN transferase [Chitinivibrionales bacterium]
LDNLGCTNYLVSAGGDILARGNRKDGKPWRVGIQHPRANGRLLATLDIGNGAVVTSGDYERYKIVEGTRYHHIFDPRTGRPARRHLSLTVVGEDPVAVDILSTGLFSMTPSEVLNFVNAHEKLECVGVDERGKVYVSEGWKEGLEQLVDTVNIRRDESLKMRD